MNASSREPLSGESSCSVRMRSAANSPISAAAQAGGDDRTVRLDLRTGAGVVERGDEQLGHRGDDAHGVQLALGGELAHARLGDQGASADHHQPFRGQRHLVDQVARDEHGPSFGGQVAQQEAGPTDAFWVKPVDGLVEEQYARIPKEGGGDPSRCPIPSEYLPARWCATSVRPDDVEYLVDARTGDVVGSGQEEEVVVRTACRVIRLGIQQCPDLAQRPPEFVVAPPVHQGRPRGRVVQSHDHAHGGGFARAVRPEEARDHAWGHLETQVVDGQGVAVALGQTFRNDHACKVRNSPGDEHVADRRPRLGLAPLFFRGAGGQPSVRSSCRVGNGSKLPEVSFW